MSKIAFLVIKSPTEQDPTHLVRRFADRADAAAILIEDGVYQALLEPAAKRLGEAAHEVLVSREDMEARGYDQSELKVGRPVEYPEIVDCIMERTERTITV